MIEKGGLAGGDDADVIDNPGGVGEEIADPGATLSMLLKLAAAAQEFHAVAAAHEGEALSLDVALRDGLAAELLKAGFVIEEF